MSNFGYKRQILDIFLSKKIWNETLQTKMLHCAWLLQQCEHQLTPTLFYVHGKKLSRLHFHLLSHSSSFIFKIWSKSKTFFKKKGFKRLQFTDLFGDFRDFHAVFNGLNISGWTGKYFRIFFMMMVIIWKSFKIKYWRNILFNLKYKEIRNSYLILYKKILSIFLHYFVLLIRRISNSRLHISTSIETDDIN